METKERGGDVGIERKLQILEKLPPRKKVESRQAAIGL